MTADALRPDRIGRAWLMLAIMLAAVLVATSAWRQGWFTPSVDLYLLLPGTSGVQVGTPVKLKGFKIGEVKSLHLQPNLNVRVRLQVHEERLPLLAVDASARLGREGPIGGKFIDINPGEQGPLLLAAGAMLPIEAGNDIDDVMASVKVAVEKLATAIGKVDPILEDTKKLTGEASAVSADVRTSLSAMMKNMEVISIQLRRVGDTATRLTAHADQDRATLVADVRQALAAATQVTAAAHATLLSVDKALPDLLDQARQSARDVNQITHDARKISAAAAAQVPPALRAGRTAVDDAAQLTTGAKRAWPFSALVTPVAPTDLPLDGFEGEKP